VIDRPVPLSTLEAVEAAELAGRIALLYGDLTRAPLPAKDWPYKGEREARLVSVLEAKQPAALLMVQNRPGRLERLVEDWQFPLPSATVPAEVGLALLRSPAAEVHLRLETRSQPGRTANVVARRRGPRPEHLVLCAHYDTKFDTPGACDNGGGVAVLLALAERLSRADLDCGLEFVAFTNEEYLPLGDDTYVQQRGEDFSQCLAALNFDGVGAALGANTITAIAASPAFEDRAREVAGAFREVVWVEPWPESNHSTFAWRGVPSLALSSTAATLHAHLRSDTVEWMSLEKLEEAADLAEALVLSVHAQPLGWARAAVPEAA
jgi:Zn-dependent M28 family amino/carboxypeptidase